MKTESFLGIITIFVAITLAELFEGGAIPDFVVSEREAVAIILTASAAIFTAFYLVFLRDKSAIVPPKLNQIQSINEPESNDESLRNMKTEIPQKELDISRLANVQAIMFYDVFRHKRDPNYRKLVDLEDLYAAKKVLVNYDSKKAYQLNKSYLTYLKSNVIEHHNEAYFTGFSIAKRLQDEGIQWTNRFATEEELYKKGQISKSEYGAVVEMNHSERNKVHNVYDYSDSKGAVVSDKYGKENEIFDVKRQKAQPSASGETETTSTQERDKGTEAESRDSSEEDNA